MGYLFLLLTILSESAAVICMKLSAGFANKTYSIIAFVTYALSFVFLTLSLKTLPAGVANALWAGVSTLLVAILGYFFFKEKLSPLQMVSLLLVVVGLVGLHLGKQVE
ncbi:MAG: multidrug efflux SMR transporter [Chitinophagaceae bacterium]|nr:multidrug efflux SMR transporter [Chitinophagaceae bacterium]